MPIKQPIILGLHFLSLTTYCLSFSARLGKWVNYLIFIYLFIYLFIYFWLRWVFVSARGPPPAAASGGHSPSRCAGLPPSRPPLLRSTGSRRAGPAIVAHGPSCSAACGILPDQGSNPCPPHRQADSQPLRHQGSPTSFFKFALTSCLYHSVSQRSFPNQLVSTSFTFAWGHQTWLLHPSWFLSRPSAYL